MFSVYNLCTSILYVKRLPSYLHLSCASLLLLGVLNPVYVMALTEQLQVAVNDQLALPDLVLSLTVMTEEN